MKTLMITTLFFICFLTTSYAQSIYKYQYTVTEDGVKMKENYGIIILTFNGNRSKCYESDQQGYKKQLGLELNYTRTKGNIHIYKEQEIKQSAPLSIYSPTSIMDAFNKGMEDNRRLNKMSGLGNVWRIPGYVTFLFSSDFRCLNVPGKDGKTYVYAYTTQEQMDNIPNELY